MVRALRVKVAPLTCSTRNPGHEVVFGSQPGCPPPSRVICWPLPSSVMLDMICRVLVMGIVPLQLKLIVSPLSPLAVAIYACNWVSDVQSVTVSVCAGGGGAVALVRGCNTRVTNMRMRAAAKRIKPRVNLGFIGGSFISTSPEICFDRYVDLVPACLIFPALNIPLDRWRVDCSETTQRRCHTRDSGLVDQRLKP